MATPNPPGAKISLQKRGREHPKARKKGKYTLEYTLELAEPKGSQPTPTSLQVITRENLNLKAKAKGKHLAHLGYISMTHLINHSIALPLLLSSFTKALPFLRSKAEGLCSFLGGGGRKVVWHQLLVHCVPIRLSCEEVLMLARHAHNSL